MRASTLALPRARGPMSEWVSRYLAGTSPSPPPRPDAGTGLSDDVQLALYLCYESHFGDLPGVVRDVEWDPQLIAVRRSLEAAFEASLAALVGPVGTARLVPSNRVADMIAALIEADDGPSISRHRPSAGSPTSAPRRRRPVGRRSPSPHRAPPTR